MSSLENKPDYYTTKAEDLQGELRVYRCHDVVLDTINGLYRCRRCKYEYPNYKLGLLLRCNIADFSECQLVTCFGEATETILDKTAEEVRCLRKMVISHFD
ncbi:replication protein A 70 kDa DNA-binding subunit-like [Limulus polyphemus]|uniref:Replication protein A 70 kDa DNA-binding subunit-like n=1 Tax=Limulus polyphemus TaxID=6850 RepID=A0ABM1TG12_LIMPO|nr:replication protein A 70 kDa DNA-binding subunit-like [Limulus polyphemus]